MASDGSLSDWGLIILDDLSDSPLQRLERQQHQDGIVARPFVSAVCFWLEGRGNHGGKSQLWVT